VEKGGANLAGGRLPGLSARLQIQASSFWAILQGGGRVRMEITRGVGAENAQSPAWLVWLRPTVQG